MAHLDRGALRLRLRAWTEVERRIAIERVIEELPEDALRSLLEGLVFIDEFVKAESPSEPTLRERIEVLIAATRRGDFLGEYQLRNSHGQREPWQTRAWIAVTSHLFELAREQAERAASKGACLDLRTLIDLIEEVDRCVDELVVFEDSRAGYHFDLRRAANIARRSPC